VTILLVIYYPIGIIQKLLPSVLPYNISLTALVLAIFFQLMQSFFSEKRR
jgi:hypothetical protein